jgi:predicted dehydrogenase
MDRRTFRVGIIGLGGMAHAHIKGVQTLGDCEIAALCDVDATRLKQAGDKLGIGSEHLYTDYRKLISDAAVDSIISVTPNQLHAEVIEACIQAGKPILSEKPFTLTYEEALRVKAVYEKNPIPSMIGFSYRYTPAFRMARRLVQEGRIGKVRTFFVQYLQGWGSPLYDAPYVWRFDKQASGTGALGDLGSHMIDLAHFIVGKFQTVSSMMETIVPERRSMEGDIHKVEVDDYASFQARMASGALGLFQTSRVAIGSDNQLEITLYGDTGTIRASTVDADHLVWIYRDDQTGQVAELKLRVGSGDRLSQWQDYHRMLTGTADETLPDLASGYENQRVIEAIVRSNVTRRTVDIDEV